MKDMLDLTKSILKNASDVPKEEQERAVKKVGNSFVKLLGEAGYTLEDGSKIVPSSVLLKLAVDLTDIYPIDGNIAECLSLTAIIDRTLESIKLRSEL